MALNRAEEGGRSRAADTAAAMARAPGKPMRVLPVRTRPASAGAAAASDVAAWGAAVREERAGL